MHLYPWPHSLSPRLISNCLWKLCLKATHTQYGQKRTSDSPHPKLTPSSVLPISINVCLPFTKLLNLQKSRSHFLPLSFLHTLNLTHPQNMTVLPSKFIQNQNTCHYLYYYIPIPSHFQLLPRFANILGSSPSLFSLLLLLTPYILPSAQQLDWPFKNTHYIMPLFFSKYSIALRIKSKLLYHSLPFSTLFKFSNLFPITVPSTHSSTTTMVFLLFQEHKNSLSHSDPLHLLSIMLRMNFLRTLHGLLPLFFQVSAQLLPLQKGLPWPLFFVSLFLHLPLALLRYDWQILKSIEKWRVIKKKNQTRLQIQAFWCPI